MNLENRLVGYRGTPMLSNLDRISPKQIMEYYKPAYDARPMYSIC